MKGNVERKNVLYAPVQNGERGEKMALTEQPIVAAINLSESYEKESTETDGKNRLTNQLLACSMVQMIQLLVGISMGYSSSLIPQLEADDSDIRLSRDQSALVASVLTIAIPIGSLSGSWVMNAFGRLKTVKLVSVPIAVAWVVIATSQTFEQLLVGRIIMGAANGMGLNAAVLFTTEVAEKNIRGILACTGIALASLGILSCYILGAYLYWRIVAWCFSALPLVLLGLLFVFSSESPSWLRDHGKEQAARESSVFFYNDPEKVLSVPKNSKNKSEMNLIRMVVLLFTTSAGLKPFILINTIFIIQQLVGVYITVYYAVTFFQESGSDIDPYIATIVIGVVRLVFCTGTALTASQLGRRPLMIGSSLAMGACMLCSAFATQRILALSGEEEVPPNWLSWVVVVSIILSVGFGSMGLQILPWSMMAEIFPHEVRGVAQPINLAFAHVYMFAVLQLYPKLTYWLGGSVGIQFLFAGMSIAAALFVWVFMLETRGLSLGEIEDYFRNNTVFLGHEKRAQKRLLLQKSATSTTAPRLLSVH